jgi:hypothetical protein
LQETQAARLSAPSQRRGGAFAELGAIDTCHPAKMRETNVECDVDHPFAGPRIQQPRIETFQPNVLQNA